MKQYSLEEIAEALAGATITGDVMHRLTSKEVTHRYFMVSYTATRVTETIAGITFLTVEGSEYLCVSQFIRDTKKNGRV